MKPTLIAMVLGLALSAGSALAQVPGERFMQVWDLDGDGKVTLEEAKTQRADIFNAFDRNSDVRLDAEELQALDAAREAEQADRPSPGRRLGLGGKGQGMKAAGEGLSHAKLDENGDGTVSGAEFVSGTAAWHARLDRDGDGVVTSDDFGRW